VRFSFDSIIAKGHTEPDPKKDITLKIDGRDVAVPQARPEDPRYCTRVRMSALKYARVPSMIGRAR
jgi:poly [ADP-ribose] polymerase